MKTVKRLLLGAGMLALSAGAAAALPAVVETDLNLRAGPGTGFPIVAAMPAGATVDVGGCTGSWCEVVFGGAQGFASRAYLGMGSAGVVAPGYATHSYGYGPGYGYYEPGYYDPAYYGDYGYYGYGYGPGVSFGFGFRGHRYGYWRGRGHHRYAGGWGGHHRYGGGWEGRDRGPRVGAMTVSHGSFATRVDGRRDFGGRSFGGHAFRGQNFGDRHFGNRNFGARNISAHGGASFSRGSAEFGARGTVGAGASMRGGTVGAGGPAINAGGGGRMGGGGGAHMGGGGHGRHGTKQVPAL